MPLKLIRRKMVLRILQGPLRGTRWIVGSSTHGCWLGSYEYEKQRILCKHIKKGFTVYDLGANAGYYSLLVSVLVGPSGHVYSFEPSPENVRFLREHLRLNQVTNCTVFDCAVSSSSEVVKFETGKLLSMGHIGTEGMEVSCVALDELVEKVKYVRQT